MKISDILVYEENNSSSILLFKVGAFYHAYEQSAFRFYHNIAKYNPIKKYYNCINSDLIWIGFPCKNITKILEPYIDKYNIIIKEHPKGFLVITGNFNISNNYDKWRSSIHDKSKPISKKPILSEEVAIRYEDKNPIHIYRMCNDSMIYIFRILENIKKEYKYSIGQDLHRKMMACIIHSHNIAEDFINKKDIRDSRYNEIESELKEIRLFIRTLTELRQISIDAQADINLKIEYILEQIRWVTQGKT